MSTDTLPSDTLPSAKSDIASPLAPVVAERSDKPVARQAASLFRVVWRWHFYAGLMVTPFIMVVAITGGLYLFAAEISDWAHRDLRFVTGVQTGLAVPYQSMVDAAGQTVAGGKPVRVLRSADSRRSVIVMVEPVESRGGGEAPDKSSRRRSRTTSVYVNPYDGTVLGHSSGPSQVDAFFRGALELHRSLWVGSTGRIVVELATTWTLVLLISGIFLWWPRRAEKRRGVWTLRWSAKSYTRWRDLHALVGVYTVPICGIILVTGLFYTLVWGKSFHVVSSHFFAATSQDIAGQDAADDHEPEPYVAPDVNVQQAMDTALAMYPRRDITLTFPTGGSDHYDVSAINDYARGTYGAMHSTGFKVHRQTGEVFELSDLANNDRYWWHTWAYPLHVGSVVGPYSKVAWLGACMALVLLPVSGIWMWWKRRPAGRSGFPRNTSLDNVPASMWLLIAVLALVLPVFGLSIIAIVILDWCLRKLALHFHRLRSKFT